MCGCVRACVRTCFFLKKKKEKEKKKEKWNNKVPKITPSSEMKSKLQLYAIATAREVSSLTALVTFCLLVTNLVSLLWNYRFRSLWEKRKHRKACSVTFFPFSTLWLIDWKIIWMLNRVAAGVHSLHSAVRLMHPNNTNKCGPQSLQRGGVLHWEHHYRLCVVC